MPSTIDQAVWFDQVWQDRGFGQSAVIDRVSGNMIGRIGLSFWPEWGEVELGYALRRVSQGRGLAKEGCRAWINWASVHLPDDHLIAVIHPDNLPSARLAQRLLFGRSTHEALT